MRLRGTQRGATQTSSRRLLLQVRMQPQPDIFLSAAHSRRIGTDAKKLAVAGNPLPDLNHVAVDNSEPPPWSRDDRLQLGRATAAGTSFSARYKSAGRCHWVRNLRKSLASVN